MLPRCLLKVSQFRFWFILQQDVDRPVGGVKQIYTVASIISGLGFSVCVVQGTSAFRPSWFPVSGLNFRTIGKQDFSSDNLNPMRDIIVIPETFLPLLQKLSRFKVIVFNQNMHYLFGEKMDLDPSFVIRAYSSPNIIAVWTVSSTDYSYAVDLLPVPSRRVYRIVNAIDENIFSFRFSTNMSIAYMPRKNSSHSHAVVEIIKNQPWFKGSGWSFTPISNKSLSAVSTILSDSSIFLSFGHPEGFGLPLAEAIVSGCLVVGYHGIGGAEISDLCKSFDVFTPVAFRDFHSFVKGVQKAVMSYDSPTGSSLHSRLLQASKLSSFRYSTESMVKSVSDAIHGVVNS